MDSKETIKTLDSAPSERDNEPLLDFEELETLELADIADLNLF